MSPDRLFTYPRESRAFLRVDISIRSYWHTLFDTVPKLLELSGPDGQAIFLPFMSWARENKLSFDWTFFLWVYKWLTQSQFRDQLSEELMLSMMSASASRWLGYDRDVDALGVVLGSTALDGAVVGWKMNSVYCRLEQVERLTFEEPLPPPDDFFGYFVTSSFELDHFAGWQPLPL
jgi:uncharacterized repeat protein (TIGR04061 family)